MTYEEAMQMILPGRYRHFKGNEYEVIGIARHSETMEPMVVYRALYGECGLWTRPAAMWYETVIRDGKSHKRFERIGQFGPLLKQEGGVIESNIEEGCIVNGDPALLTRAVYNLIDNAVRHMGEDRKIIVSAKNGERILLEVKDHGSGINETELPHIWEKYYTSRQRGNKGISGLGLAIVKEIAEIHSAECGADSKKNEGSRFWLLIKKQ